MEVFVFSSGIGRDYFFGPLAENIWTTLSKSVLPVLQERDWSLLFHKGLSHSGPWTVDWVPFSLTALSSVQNIYLPLFSNGHIPAILQKLDQSLCQENSLKQACSKMLLRALPRWNGDLGQILAGCIILLGDLQSTRDSQVLFWMRWGMNYQSFLTGPFNQLRMRLRKRKFAQDLDQMEGEELWK